MWKLLVALLLNRKKTFTKGVRIRGNLYIVSVKEYVSDVDRLEKWKSALKAEINQGT